MEPDIDLILKKTAIFKSKLDDLVKSYDYPNHPKSKLLIAYHSIIAEHHEAIPLLIQNDLHGSAFALVRSLYDTLYRAHWIIGCATDQQIDEVLKGKNIFPKLKEMVAMIDAAFGIGNFFQNLKKNSWGSMNDYVHSGIRQIGRRFKNNTVDPNYEDGEIAEVLNGINVGLMLMAIVFFQTFGKIEASKEVEKMLTEYIDTKD